MPWSMNIAKNTYFTPKNMSLKNKKQIDIKCHKWENSAIWTMKVISNFGGGEGSVVLFVHISFEKLLCDMMWWSWYLIRTSRFKAKAKTVKFSFWWV